MKCMILGAGYATRLYPLTENFPKPLLKVQERTILDWLLDDIDESGIVSEYILISNHKFYNHFKEWINDKRYSVKLLDDGSVSNETRLGAVKDIEFAIESLSLDDDLLIIAGDNLLDFSLKSFIQYCDKKKSSCVMRYFEEDKSKLSKYGLIKPGDDDLILEMKEKPEKPDTNWVCPPFYFITREDIKLVKEAIESGVGVDAPGSFITWLCKQRNVYAMEMPGHRYDIGTIESYEKIQNTDLNLNIK